MVFPQSYCLLLSTPRVRDISFPSTLGILKCLKCEIKFISRAHLFFVKLQSFDFVFKHLHNDGISSMSAGGPDSSPSRLVFPSVFLDFAVLSFAKIPN